MDAPATLTDLRLCGVLDRIATDLFWIEGHAISTEPNMEEV